MKEINILINYLIFFLIFLIKIIKSDSPPKWEWEPPAIIEMPEDSSVDLHCPVRGRPSPIIRWSFNSIPFYELSDDYNNKRIQLNEGRLLRINSLKRDLDTGLYQCNATNVGGYLDSSTYLNVLAFAPRFRHSSQRVWKVLRDSSVDLNCDVEAAPIAEVQWVDANDTNILPVPGKLEIFPNFTLRLHSLSSSDDGFYYCNVSNKYGLNRALNRLEVFTPTFFAEIPQPSRITLDANSPNSDHLELRCKAIADNRLSIDYIWTKNGSPIKNEENIKIIIEEDGTSILSLFHLSGHHTGHLECSAVTEVDVKSAAIDLFVRDVPERPELMRVDCSSGRHALLVWKRPSINILNNELPLTTFIVEAKTDQNSENWEKVFEEYLGGEEETATGPRILHKTAIPLRPWANYTFRLFAVNSHGSSQPSQPMPSSPLECFSPLDVPFQNPLGVTAAGTEPDNLIISWQPLPRDRWNAPGLRYLVRYRRLDTKDGDWNEFLVEDPFANQTIIREQPTFRPYQVQIRAINSLGFSALEPPIVEGWSGEDVPTESPKNLRLAEHHNYSFVSLEWEPIENSSIRGHFRGYRIDYWMNIHPIIVHSLYSTSNSQLIGGLEALQYYTAKVHLLNNRFESKPSNLLEFKTIEGIPSKVHNLRVHSVGSRSVLVTWQPPLYPNGNLRGYFITFQNGLTDHIEETYVLHRQQFYLHEQLKPNTPYRISVWAETGGGEGPRLWRNTKTWPFRNFNDEWKLSEWITLPQTSLELKNLKEDTDYIIIGISREIGASLSYSKPLTIKTENYRMISLFNKERIRSAAWFLSVLIVSVIVLSIVCAMCALSQRNSGGLVGVVNGIKLREKRFGPAFRIDNLNRDDLSSEEGSSSSSNYLIMKPRNVKKDESKNERNNFIE
uniref:Uncharacterized protein n=2 Tax=Meloidogyne incognita TaxID=6306 RepID=A0A914LB34_MELIC